MTDAKDALGYNNPLIPTIVYEDDDILAVNKPAGLMVHADGKNTEDTLCEWLLSKYPKIKGVGEPLLLADAVLGDQV